MRRARGLQHLIASVDETTALCGDVFDFLALPEDCPADDKGVLPEHPVERTERPGRGVKVKRPVVSEFVGDAVAVHPVRQDVGAPGLDFADDAAGFEDVACCLGYECFYPGVFLVVGRDADHLIQRHGKKKGTYDHMTL